MLYNVNDLVLINKMPESLQKALVGKPKSMPTMAQVKELYKKTNLPDGGHWVTLRGGHHVYIKDGKIVAGGMPGIHAKSGPYKSTERDLKNHQAEHREMQRDEKRAKQEAAKKPDKPVTSAKDKNGKSIKVGDKVRIHDIYTKKPTKTIRTVTKMHKQGADGTILHFAEPGLPTGKLERTYRATDVEHHASEVKAPVKGAEKDAKPKTATGTGKKPSNASSGNGTGRNGSATGGVSKPAPNVPAKSGNTEKPGVKTSEVKKPAKPKKAVADVRTEGQIGNELSYDVGASVFGSRKDLAQLRTELNDKIKKGMSVRGVLANLEQIDPGAAKKYCTKDNILQKYDWQAQHKQGVELPIAMTKKLILDRIQPKPDKDDPETRRQYAHAIEELHRVLTPVKTMDDLRGVRNALRDRMRLELPKHLLEQNRYLDYAKKEAAREPGNYDLMETKYGPGNTTTRVPITAKEWKKRKADNVKKIEATMTQWAENAKNPYHVLGEKLTNFFTDGDSANNTFKTIMSKNPKWEDYLDPQEKTAKPKKNRKAMWERKIDDPNARSGGRAGKVQKPEDAVKQFGLRGVQFGHWVDDTSGKFHLLKASEALQDMADTLGMKDKDVSLNGRLALAFGARGIAGMGAVAHYEPDLRVINLTKEGGAGSLAHEWGHALDDIMADHSGIMGYASESPHDIKHPEVRQAFSELVDAIHNGDGSHTGTMQVVNQQKPFRSIWPNRRKAIVERGLTPEVIKEFTDGIHRTFEAETRDLMKHINGERGYLSDPEKAKKKLKTQESRKKREINELHQELMYHHYRKTGEHVSHIDVPTEGSEYANRMKELDGDRSKAYYSTGREMFARVFESWMQHQLESKGNKNHYLVAGTSEKMVNAVGAPFPKGTERKHMFDKMGKLMKTIVGSGEIKKALESDLQKSLFNEDEHERDEAGRFSEAITEHNDLLTKYASRFGSAEEFAEAVNRPGFGGKSVGEVFGIIDANSHNHLDADAIKTYLSQGGDYYYLTHVDPRTLDVQDEGHLQGIHATPFNQATAKPIVVGNNRFIVDGRHRTVNAKQSGAPRIQAYVPAKHYYELYVGTDPLQKAVISDPTTEPGGMSLPDDPYTMFRGIGQKELDFIQKNGFVQSKGKGNDGDQGKVITCFTNLFTQAEGYARSNYTLYGEKAAYVIVLPRPPWVYENDAGELESDLPVPFALGTVIPIPNPDDPELQKAAKFEEAKHSRARDGRFGIVAGAHSKGATKEDLDHLFGLKLKASEGGKPDGVVKRGTKRVATTPKTPAPKGAGAKGTAGGKAKAGKADAGKGKSKASLTKPPVEPKQVKADKPSNPAFTNPNLPPTSLGGFAPEHAELVQKTIKSLYTRFPELAQDAHEVMSFTVAKEPNQYGVGGFYRVERNAHEIRSTILLNDHAIRDGAMTSGASQVKTGKAKPADGFMVDTSLEGVVTHEIGHAIDRVVYAAYNYKSTYHPDMRIAGAMLTRMATEFADHGNVPGQEYHGAYGLSRYSTANEREFLAEAFTEYILSPKPRPIAAEFGRRLERAIRGMRGEAPTSEDQKVFDSYLASGGGVYEHHVTNILKKGGEKRDFNQGA